MKIAIFTDFFLPKVDGVVTSLEQLILELDRTGHELLIVAPDTDDVPQKIGKNIQLCYVPSVPALVYPGLRIGLPTLKMRKMVRGFDPDVILSVTPITIGGLGMRMAKNMKKPCISVFHGYVMKPEYLQLLGIKKGVKQIEAAAWTLFRNFFNSFNVIISPSEMVREDLIAHHFTKPIFVCRNGLNINTKLTKKVSEDLAKIVAERKLHSKKVLIYVGRLSKEKNLEMLLNVFKKVVQKESEAQLLIIGGGPIEEDLKAQAIELGVEKNVIFWGQVNHQDLIDQQLLRLGYVFCSCSTSEVQPMSVIEAMLFGLPLVLPNVPSMKELINGNGSLASPDSEEMFSQKIIEILQDEKLHQELSQASLKNAETFLIEETGKQYLAAFEQAIKELSLS